MADTNRYVSTTLRWSIIKRRRSASTAAMSSSAKGSIEGNEWISWSPQAMHKPARRTAIAIGTTDSSELETRRLMSADLPELATGFAETAKLETARPEMAAPKVALPAPPIRFVRIAQVPESSNIHPTSKPVDIVPIAIDVRGARPEFAALRQIVRGPSHYQTSLGDPLSVKFGSPMNSSSSQTGKGGIHNDPAGSEASITLLPSYLEHSGKTGSALEFGSTPAIHLDLRSPNIGGDILTHVFEIANDRLTANSPDRRAMPIPFSIEMASSHAVEIDSAAHAPALFAVPHNVEAAFSIDPMSVPTSSGQSQRNAPVTVSPASQSNDPEKFEESADFGAHARESSVESHEAPLKGWAVRSETNPQSPATESAGNDSSEASEARTKDDIWSRISDAFDLEDNDFEPIGEPLEDSVEIDENELSAAVDRVLEDFAFPVEESIASPRIGTAIGLAAGTAITIRIVLRRRRETETRQGQRGSFAFDRTTQVRPDLDASAAGRR